MGISGRLLTIIFTVTASLSSQQAAATDDEYLKMLEQEAKELEVDKSGQLERNETSEEDSAVNVMNIKLKSGETLDDVRSFRFSMPLARCDQVRPPSVVRSGSMIRQLVAGSWPMKTV